MKPALCAPGQVGSSYGFCSLLLAKLGYRVLAFDANSWHARLLAGAAKLNGLSDRITVRHTAVGEQVTEILTSDLVM